MLLELFFSHLVTLFTILLFSVKLWSRKTFRHTENRYFWITVISCLILVMENALEMMSAKDPSLRFFRTLLSVIGYTCRSTAALGLLLVIIQKNMRDFLLWIPSLLTLVVCSTAFFTDIAFGYDSQYHFYRRPLGYIVFIVPVFYLILILRIGFKRFSERNGTERFIWPISAFFCIVACVADVVQGGARLIDAILISSIFMYIILYSHDNRRDPLTGLLNRQAFYDDCAVLDKSIGAAASVDMNGLKQLNDSQGHNAGDEALIQIGKCLHDITDRNTIAYRVGGDEFIILFLHGNEDRIKQLEDQLKKSVTDRGYSIAAGYALRDNKEELNEAIKESDQRMYEDKAKHYLLSRNDRRRRSDRASDAGAQA